MSNARVTKSTEQVVVRLPHELLAWAKADAAARSCTLTAVIAQALTRLRRRDADDGFGRWPPA